MFKHSTHSKPLPSPSSQVSLTFAKTSTNRGRKKTKGPVLRTFP